MKHTDEFSAITQRIVSELQERDRKGRTKYGTTLDRTDLTRLEWLQHAKEKALDFVCYLERIIAEETQSGENTLSKNTPPSNAKPIGDHLKGTGQEPFDYLAQSIISQHKSFDASEVRRIWLTIFNGETGRELCRVVRDAIRTGEGLESLKPDGDPVEKMKTIQYAGNGNPDALETLFKACGHSVKFVQVTDKAEFREANKKAGAGEAEN